MATIATEAQRIVRDAARPVIPGDTIKAQLRRAWSNLGRPSFWRVRAAWYGESGAWSAVALEDLRERYRRWRGAQEARGRAEAAALAARLSAQRDGLVATDPDFHRPNIDRLERLLRELGGDGRAVAVRPSQDRTEQDGDS